MMMSIENMSALACVSVGFICTIPALRIRKRKKRLLSRYGWGVATNTVEYLKLSARSRRYRWAILACYMSAFVLHVISLHLHDGYSLSHSLVFLVPTAIVVALLALYLEYLISEYGPQPLICLGAGSSVILFAFFWVYPYVALVLAVHALAYGLWYVFFTRQY